MTADPLAGVRLGKYQIIEPLGIGGMSTVYRAYQENLSREVALKVLPPQLRADPSFLERFHIEAMALARLKHPNIIVIYDADSIDMWVFIVMELINGPNLRRYLRNSISMLNALRIFHHIAQGVAYAHSKGIIHRDIKPSNVLMDISENPQNPRPVLTDFGVVKLMESPAKLTQTGAGVGTPEYMAPEQCQGEPIDQRADIYALGILLFEMLCGKPPFSDGNFTSIAHSHIFDPVPDPALLNPAISQDLRAIVQKALQKDPARRYQQVTEFDSAVMELAQSSGKSKPASRPLASPIYTTCKICAAHNSPAAAYCWRCGAAMPVSDYRAGQLRSTYIICDACAAPESSSFNFCTRCGEPLRWVSCAVCGAPRSLAQRHCMQCGNL